MKITEKVIDISIREASVDALRKSGLEDVFKGRTLRRWSQLHLPNGIADYVVVNRIEEDGRHKIEINVIEYKRNKIDWHTFLQATRYLAQLKIFIWNRVDFDTDNYRFKVTLIGDKISDNEGFLLSLILLQDPDYLLYSWKVIEGGELVFNNEDDLKFVENTTFMNRIKDLYKRFI